MKVLDPIWHTKTETASRVRGRMEAVLDWAKARRLCEGDNPALWRGHLDQLLPKRSRVQKVVHHPALPFDEMGAFMRDLGAEVGVAARGFEFQILTAARTGEVIGAYWDEIDEGRARWVIPGRRMKAGKEHRVALSERAIAVLSAMRAERQSEFVFSGQRIDRPLSNMALLAVLKRMGRSDLTVRGFRSSFRSAHEGLRQPEPSPGAAIASRACGFNLYRFNPRGLICQHGLRVIFRLFQFVFFVKYGS